MTLRKGESSWISAGADVSVVVFTGKRVDMTV